MINPLRIGAYAAWLAAEVVRGALVLARDVVTPGAAMSPAIVELPLRCHTDLEISLMASSVTITPGTVTIGVAAADGGTPPTLFVHAIYGKDADQVVGSLRDMEDRVLTMTRGGAPGKVDR
jgi:multicomponent Na+:H+ antiporter subunit E